jgi:NAD(P)-dependent dehydrogenase (short-subunit alcohol dehydrogenase family)
MTENAVKLLEDRIILVTGASRGIGRAVAKAYAKNGATVILLARNVKQLENLYDEIEKAGYPKPAIYPFNLATATIRDYEDLFKNIENHFGRLDGILHNAADLGSLTPLEYYPIEQWYQVLQVNLNSTFLLTQVTLPLLKLSDHASVVFTTADVAENARAYWGAYAVSKFGLKGLMQILNQELEVNTHIRVNSIDPGKVRTSLRASAFPGENPKNLPMPEEIVSTYLYLMGKESRAVRGKHFCLNKKRIVIEESL